MKSLLVPIEDHDQTVTMLRVAEMFARRFDSNIDGVGLRLAQFQAVGAEPIVAVTFPPIDADEIQTLKRSRERFEAFARSLPQDAPKMRWRPGDPVEDSGLGALGRVYDVTVIGRPTISGAGSRMTTLEAALFDSGRPILIAPPQVPDSIGNSIVIAWNCSTEGAQTMTAALPILAKAQSVTILTVEGATVPGPSGEELKGYLGVHGIAAQSVTRSSSSSAGAATLEFARDTGCDLLIKSAYTQSRLRQMIFGGATSHILSNATLPVFMAN